jgi:hypothetical protein
LQSIAAHGLEVLLALGNELSAWSASVSRAAQLSTHSTQRDAALRGTPSKLAESGYWLLLAAGCQVESMQNTRLCNIVDERQLLDTLGRLVVRVRTEHERFLLHSMLSSSHPANLLSSLQTTGCANCQDVK